MKGQTMNATEATATLVAGAVVALSRLEYPTNYAESDVRLALVRGLRENGWADERFLAFHEKRSRELAAEGK